MRVDTRGHRANIYRSPQLLVWMVDYRVHYSLDICIAVMQQQTVTEWQAFLDGHHCHFEIAIGLKL